jgi:hypothetical protein
MITGNRTLFGLPCSPRISDKRATLTPTIRNCFTLPAASLNLDLQNAGATTLTNLTFYFRGVKLYPYGTEAMYSYPSKFSTLPFTCPRTYTALPVTTPTNGLRSIFRPPFDSDFVLRSIQAGPSFDRSSYEVFMTLLDENEKPYSNAPVHIDVLAGRSLMPAAYPSGTTTLAPTGTGASIPDSSIRKFTFRNSTSCTMTLCDRMRGMPAQSPKISPSRSAE